MDEPDPTQRDYDESPYPGYAYWFTHPDHLGVVGWLHGLDAAAPATARVLELGCGDGGNLLPMAQGLPEATFVGVDLAAAHVVRAREGAAAIGARNIQLVQGDLATISPGDLLRAAGEPADGAFDYIIAHGVYGWVPDAARDGIMRLAADLLAPHGVMLVSYDTLPGAFDGAGLRRLLRFHTRPVDEAADKVAQARAMARWYCVREAQRDPEGRETQMARLLRQITDAPDALVRHDLLAEHYRAFWFEEVVDHGARRGLAYLANGRPARLRIQHFDADVQRMLRGVRDPVRRQQYMDFFERTAFRTTTFCRAERTVTRAVDASRFDDLLIESLSDRSAPWDAPGDDLDEALVVEVRGVGGVAVRGAALRIVLGELQRAAPEALALRALFDRALPAIVHGGHDGGKGGDEAGRAELFEAMVRELYALYLCELVHLRRAPSGATRAVSAAPRTGPWQRLQAARGATYATTLSHRNVALGPLEWRVLHDLDGGHDHAALAAAHGDGATIVLEALALAGLLSG